jgi:hypothetical protein
MLVVHFEVIVFSTAAGDSLDRARTASQQQAYRQEQQLCDLS